MNWTVFEPSVAPVAFPPGNSVFETNTVDETLFLEVDRLLFAGHCEEGRLELESGNTRLMALIHKSAPYAAGLQEGEAFTRVPLHDFVVRARQMEDPVCRLVSCDSALVLMTAVHFGSRPDLGGSLKLINPAHVLRVLAKEQRDAAIALEHDGTRTLLFLHRGHPARLFFGNPADDPDQGTIEERLLLWAFDRISSTRVEIFSNLKVAPDSFAGSSFARLNDEAQPAPPATVFVSMDGRQIRVRPFTPPEMIIGRDPRVDIFIDNLGVSGRHARLWWERGRFMISDLGSSNGTAVNGRRIDSAAISEGDDIRIGKFRLRIEEEEQEPQVPETHLIMANGPSSTYWLASSGGRHRIDRDLLLGRGRGVDVSVKGWGVGPVHARLSPLGNHLLLTCLNGRKVEVNGELVGAATLAAGDDLVVGRSRFWIAREGVRAS
jgi:pSer/pThr/pTyr-binding forkhead associated (FHA) protein